MFRWLRARTNHQPAMSDVKGWRRTVQDIRQYGTVNRSQCITYWAWHVSVYNADSGGNHTDSLISPLLDQSNKSITISYQWLTERWAKLCLWRFPKYSALKSAFKRPILIWPSRSSGPRSNFINQSELSSTANYQLIFGPVLVKYATPVFQT